MDIITMCAVGPKMQLTWFICEESFAMLAAYVRDYMPYFSWSQMVSSIFHMLLTPQHMKDPHTCHEDVTSMTQICLLTWLQIEGTVMMLKSTQQKLTPNTT